jgi:AcrR family transcriptional regulator
VRLGRKEAAVKNQRGYHSPLRESQARETRRRVIDSARELFLEQGYPATTIAAVARRAGVSADTIYSTFGSKGALLKGVLDVVIGGDDAPSPLLDRADPQAMRAEPDQRRQLAMFAAGITQQLERIRPMDDILRSAAAVDAVAADLRADLQLRQRREAMTAIVAWIAAHGPLQEGLSQQDAAAVVWTLTSPEVHQMLRDTWDWPPERYEQWLRETLTATLLPPPPR